MKKIILTLVLIFTCSYVYAENVIVWMKPDKSVRVTVCADNDELHCLQATLEALPELAGLEYEFVDRALMPDVVYGNKIRESWEKEKGKDFKINKEKEDAVLAEQLIQEKIKKAIRQDAIDKLKLEGKLPADYGTTK